MKAIYKREIRAHFNTMTGYIFTAIVMLFISLNFKTINLTGGFPYFAYALSSALLVFVIGVPILTMRSMAEERRWKTDQLLLTYPVSVAGIVLGKFFAMMTVFAIPLAFSCLCPVVISLGYSSSFLIDYASILAFLCLGCLFVSIGMFISSLTESQVIAAVGSMGALLALCMWPQLIAMLPTAAGTGPLTKWLQVFSVTSVLSNFSSYYLFDVRGLLFLLSGAALFLLLTVQSVRKRRWN
ncbi:MAG: ABC transporter permease [Oscillospiraceae bacterium]|jgi:ABC-2 type transport system permease protein|nr:ABC transporter permease [Oscillospiraceae bacterium]